jgi:beta-galactosidase/beta-glucuronidase
VVKVDQKPTESTLEGNWTVHFDPKWGGPERIQMDQLKSWIKFDEPGIKYYSGTATYFKSFVLTESEIKDKQVHLDLGNVQEMASVKVNGTQLQVIWSAPFRYDITRYVKTGGNKLEVEVVNMWPNRLIGDAGLPVEQRLTKTNINKFDGADREKYLRESGLLGPVKIRMAGTRILSEATKR